MLKADNSILNSRFQTETLKEWLASSPCLRHFKWLPWCLDHLPARQLDLHFITLCNIFCGIKCKLLSLEQKGHFRDITFLTSGGDLNFGQNATLILSKILWPPNFYMFLSGKLLTLKYIVNICWSQITLSWTITFKQRLWKSDWPVAPVWGTSGDFHDAWTTCQRVSLICIS